MHTSHNKGCLMPTFRYITCLYLHRYTTLRISIRMRESQQVSYIAMLYANFVYHQVSTCISPGISTCISPGISTCISPGINLYITRYQLVYHQVSTCISPGRRVVYAIFMNDMCDKLLLSVMQC